MSERTYAARALRAGRRRAMMRWLRVRHPRARFGAGCDVRPTLRLFLGATGVLDFGDHCVLDNDMTLEVRGVLRVGSRTIFGHHCTIAVAERVDIGNNCLIAELVSIRDHDHRTDRLDIPIRDQGSVSGPVRIGNNVWLGSKVTVIRGVTIGDNVIIGAGAVVTRDIPANAIALGVPARVAHFRSSDLGSEDAGPTSVS